MKRKREMRFIMGEFAWSSKDFHPPKGTVGTLTWEEDVEPHRCDKMWSGWEWVWTDNVQVLFHNYGERVGSLPFCPFCGEPVEGNHE